MKLFLLLFVLCCSSAFAQKLNLCERKILERIVSTDNMTGVCDDVELSKKENDQLRAKFRLQAKKKTENITLQFKDPESVKLKNLSISDSGLVICGEVNARNSYGGFVGYKKFYYTWPIDLLILEGNDLYSSEKFAMDCKNTK